jgi:hypothetical protein
LSKKGRIGDMDEEEIHNRKLSDDTNVEVSQSYQPEPYRKDSQSECYPIETTVGQQVPEGWLIARHFTAKIGPLTMRLLALFNQCFVNGHWRWMFLRCRLGQWREFIVRMIICPQMAKLQSSLANQNHPQFIDDKYDKLQVQSIQRTDPLADDT